MTICWKLSLRHRLIYITSFAASSSFVWLCYIVHIRVCVVCAVHTQSITQYYTYAVCTVIFPFSTLCVIVVAVSVPLYLVPMYLFLSSSPSSSSSGIVQTFIERTNQWVANIQCTQAPHTTLPSTRSTIWHRRKPINHWKIHMYRVRYISR